MNSLPTVLSGKPLLVIAINSPSLSMSTYAQYITDELNEWRGRQVWIVLMDVEFTSADFCKSKWVFHSSLRKKLKKKFFFGYMAFPRTEIKPMCHAVETWSITTGLPRKSCQTHKIFKNNLHSKLEDNKPNYCWSLDINFKWVYYSLDMKFIVHQLVLLKKVRMRWPLFRKYNYL